LSQDKVVWFLPEGWKNMRFQSVVYGLMVHMLTLHLNGNEITHVINDIGAAATGGNVVARVNQFP
jgi:hypothetical protein